MGDAQALLKSQQEWPGAGRQTVVGPLGLEENGMLISVAERTPWHPWPAQETITLPFGY